MQYIVYFITFELGS